MDRRILYRPFRLPPSFSISGSLAEFRRSFNSSSAGDVEADRFRTGLYNGLQELLGTDRATYLMTHLLPAEMPDFLTKTEFGIEMSQVRTEVSQVKTEMSRINTELSDLGTRFTKLEDKLDTRFTEVTKRIDRVLLAVVGGLFVMVAAMSGTLRP